MTVTQQHDSAGRDDPERGAAAATAALVVRQLRTDGPNDAATMDAFFDLRARVLRPGQPKQRSHFSGDDAPGTIHFGAFLNEQLVGVATLLNEGDGLRLRGMAVDETMRGRSIGAALLGAIHQAAAERHRPLWCNARAVAVGFYQRYGWIVEGDVFDLPDIGPHYVMRRAINGG